MGEDTGEVVNVCSRSVRSLAEGGPEKREETSAARSMKGRKNSSGSGVKEAGLVPGCFVVSGDGTAWTGALGVQVWRARFTSSSGESRGLEAEVEERW